jgi:hypothetical protein
VLIVLLTSASTLVAALPGQPAAKTTRVSVSSASAQGNAGSYDPALSANGRFVVFESYASNFVRGDRNGVGDVFVRDRRTRTTRRVSVSSAGTQGNAESFNAAISANGRFVVFVSAASNLVAGDTNGVTDVFVYNRRARRTTRVSVGAAGAEANANSSALGTPALSANGRFVAFRSDASNLVAADGNGATDIFIRDRRTRRTTRVSVSSTGEQGSAGSWTAALSADGRFVAFDSTARNLVAGDTNARLDVFVRDRRTRTTRRVSVSSGGAQGNNDSSFPVISANGRFVAFESLASTLAPGGPDGSVDVFVHDRRTRKTTRVSVSSAGAQGNDDSFRAAISADGRFVAFVSAASNLVARDRNGTWDVFVHDRRTRRTTRVSVSSTGAQGNKMSSSFSAAALAGNGRSVAFESEASNLVARDRNGSSDVFVRGPLR